MGGVEDGEQRALFGVIGQDRLGGPGDGGLAGAADGPGRIEHDEQRIAQPHHAFGHEGGQHIHQQDADRHDGVADDHEGTELAELAVGAVHQGADEGVGDGVQHTHGGDHDRGKDGAQQQDLAAEGCHIGQNQNVVDVAGTIVQREQRQLIHLGAVYTGMMAGSTGVFGCFTHLRLLLLSK